jgi:transcriptional regulator with XRE-family HTH domain
VGQTLNAKNLRIGAKLRHSRRLKNLSLKELARRVGCSESLLSKVENDKLKPSLQMLHSIVAELDTTIGALFSANYSEDHVVMRSTDRPIISMKSMTHSDGVRLECLIPYPESQLIYGSIHVVEPGKGSEGKITHQGEEVGYVLVGELDLTVNKKTYRLKEGDSFFFQSHLPHGYKNPGKVTARILWINSPPTF